MVFFCLSDDLPTGEQADDVMQVRDTDQMLLAVLMVFVGLLSESAVQRESRVWGQPILLAKILGNTGNPGHG